MIVKLYLIYVNQIIILFLGLIKQVVQHSAQTIYTRVTKDEDVE